MTDLCESDVAELAMALLAKQGYSKAAIDKLNHGIPDDAEGQALRDVLNLPRRTLVENNEVFHRMPTERPCPYFGRNGKSQHAIDWMIKEGVQT